MGLFDFIKDAGAKIFDSDGQEAKRIKELIEKDFAGQVTNLTVEYDDGKVTLGGECNNMSTKEKIILIAGNLKDVKQVDDTKLKAKVVPQTTDGNKTPAQNPVKEPEPRFYTIKSGDTLSKIAKQYYGDAMKYPKLFEANKEVIKDPDKIYPGQVIRVPEL